MFSTVLVALVLVADPPQGATIKNLMRDSIAAPEKGDGPDVSKLPFTNDSIKQVVVAYQPRIQGCYEEHLSNKKKAPEGTIKTAFVITPDGVVKNAKVNRKTSTLKDPGLHDCVVAVLSAMVFPKPPDAKDHPVEFPFNLKAVE